MQDRCAKHGFVSGAEELDEGCTVSISARLSVKNEKEAGLRRG